MKRKVSVSVAVLLVWTGIAAGCNPSFSQKRVELHILAASSLTEAVKELETVYEASQPEIDIVVSYASSGKLKQQIEQGAPADVFLSAGEKEVKELERKGLVNPAERADLLRNELVLIIPEEGRQPVKKFENLADSPVDKLALGLPETVPAGRYAMEALRGTDQWNDLRSRVVYGGNVRQVLSHVAAGNADAGLVYRTDLSASRSVKVADVVPPDTYPPIRYPAAVIEGSDHPKQARSFYRWLKGKKAQSIFKKHGFKGAAASE
ncbi:molybdate ABC transporter substrate-binding protein [Paludifilum halophilum]|nr:molybdate ABC transporter substrate-binding protein [Paludifilum halophilum]